MATVECETPRLVAVADLAGVRAGPVAFLPTELHTRAGAKQGGDRVAVAVVDASFVSPERPDRQEALQCFAFAADTDAARGQASAAPADAWRQTPPQAVPFGAPVVIEPRMGVLDFLVHSYSRGDNDAGHDAAVLYLATTQPASSPEDDGDSPPWEDFDPLRTFVVDVPAALDACAAALGGGKHGVAPAARAGESRAAAPTLLEEVPGSQGRPVWQDPLRYQLTRYFMKSGKHFDRLLMVPPGDAPPHAWPRRATGIDVGDPDTVERDPPVITARPHALMGVDNLVLPKWNLVIDISRPTAPQLHLNVPIEPATTYEHIVEAEAGHAWVALLARGFNHGTSCVSVTLLAAQDLVTRHQLRQMRNGIGDPWASSGASEAEHAVARAFVAPVGWSGIAMGEADTLLIAAGERGVGILDIPAAVEAGVAEATRLPAMDAADEDARRKAEYERYARVLDGRVHDTASVESGCEALLKHLRYVPFESGALGVSTLGYDAHKAPPQGGTTPHASPRGAVTEVVCVPGRREAFAVVRRVRNARDDAEESSPCDCVHFTY